MDPQFEALAAQISRDVTAAVSENVTEAVTERLTAAVTGKVTTDVNVHVTDVLTAAERRLASQARTHMEAVRSEARMATENYGAQLETINRRLDRIEEKVTDNHRDTAAILKNHNQRITALESSRSQPAQ